MFNEIRITWGAEQPSREAGEAYIGDGSLDMLCEQQLKWELIRFLILMAGAREADLGTRVALASVAVEEERRLGFALAHSREIAHLSTLIDGLIDGSIKSPPWPIRVTVTSPHPAMNAEFTLR